MNIDILMSEDIVINLLRKMTVIKSCDNIEVFLAIITKLINQISKTILIKCYIIISSQSNLIIVIIQLNLFYNYDFLFKFNCRYTDVFIYVYIVDYIISEMHVCNDENVSLIISYKFRMN